jgi:predicted lipid carrier protein YhbT
MPKPKTASPPVPPLLALALRPLPLAPLQPVLALLTRRIGERYPGLYERLGPHAGKRFGIQPTDLPFAFVLEPDPARPAATAVRRLPAGLDARILGPLSGLIGMAEGTLDGDALFFSRTLVVEGDVEAVLALRNAIDDARIDLVGTLLGGLMPFAPALIQALRRHDRTAASRMGSASWN